MVKLSGVAMIVFASVLAAGHLISQERRRVECVEGFYLLISLIKEQIECYSAPIKKILPSCDDRIIRRLGLDQPPTDFGEILSGCEDVLDDDSKKTLREFSSTLGKSYRDVQIRTCNKALSELDIQLKGLRAAYPARKKTVIALCAAIGGMAVIALI